MDSTFACGRCAHRFVPQADGPDAAVCPECGFDFCYRLGALSAPASAPSQETLDLPAQPQVSSSESQSRQEQRSQSPSPASTQEELNVDTDTKPSTRSLHALAVLFVISALMGLAWTFWPHVDPDQRADKSPRTTAFSKHTAILDSASKADLAKGSNDGQESGVRQESGRSDSALEDSIRSDRGDVIVARSLKEAGDAIVKIVIPLGVGNLARHGTGFFINDRGWVITNNHVLKGVTTDSRIKLADGSQVEIEGIVARSPQHDLAIVKVKKWTEPLTILDVGFADQVPLGGEVFTFGHPYNVEFSLSKGIVSRYLSTEDWAKNVPNHLAARMGFARDMKWIQHDAKISPGNSGGPLLNEQAQVLGLNTFVHSKAEFGYASQVTYIRQLLNEASDELEPLPASQKGMHMNVSSGQIRELSRQAARMRWVPATSQEFAVLAELAKQMTIVKQVSLAPSAGKNQVAQRVASVADEEFANLRKRRWSRDEINAIQAFALPALDDHGGGFFASCTFVANADAQKAWVAIVDGTQEFVYLRGGNRYAPAPRNTKALVMGLVIPQIVKLNLNINANDQRRTSNREASVVLVGYVIRSIDAANQ